MDNHKAASNSPLRLALLLAPVVLLSGCTPLDWIKGKLGVGERAKDAYAFLDEDLSKDGSKALATMGDKVIVSEKSFERDFNQLLADNPQLQQVLPMMPDAKAGFLKGIVSQAVVDKDIADKGIDQTPEYQEELARTVRTVKSMLNTKYFSQQYQVQVSDADAQKFYDDNKTSMADLLISRGGVHATGVSCKSEAEAKDLAARAKGKDLTKVADSAGKKANVRDFKLVNSDSIGIDATLKSKIVAMKKFPAVEVIKAGDGNFWVVSAASSEEPKYRAFAEVKEGIKQYLAKEKRMEIINQQIERLRTELKVVVNDQFLNPAANADQPEHHVANNVGADASDMQPASRVA